MRLFRLTPLILFAAIMLGSSIRTPMIIDEYVFYKLASNFPDYSSTPAWFDDRPELLNRSIDWSAVDADRDELFSMVYETPIYTHPPLPVILVSPIVKGLNYLADKNIIPHIEEEPGILGISEEDARNSRAEVITNILRLISISLCTFSMYLMYKIAQAKYKTSIWLFAMPIASSIIMLASSMSLFYWDVFMMFFFILTLYLMEKKSKWQYLAACCLVNTKIFVGIALLIPLIIKAFKDNRDWKMILPVLSIIPFYMATFIITGEPFYLFTHYLAQTQIHDIIYEMYSLWDYVKVLFAIGIHWVLLMTIPVMWFWKKYPEFVLFLLMTFFYAWGTGLGLTHTSSVVYASALIFPIVAYEFKIIERIRGWVKIES